MTLVQNPTTFAIEDVPDYISEVATVASDISVASSTTLVNAPTLVIPYGRSQRFFFRFGLFYSAAAAGGLKYRLALPATAALWRAARRSIAPDALTTLVTAFDIGNTGAVDIALTAASGTDGVVFGEGIFVAPASADGAMQIQFAQNASSASPTVLRAGSYLEYKQY